MKSEKLGFFCYVNGDKSKYVINRKQGLEFSLVYCQLTNSQITKIFSFLFSL